MVGVKLDSANIDILLRANILELTIYTDNKCGYSQLGVPKNLDVCLYPLTNQEKQESEAVNEAGAKYYTALYVDTVSLPRKKHSLYHSLRCRQLVVNSFSVFSWHVV